MNWQPSRFLVDRTEAERAFALTEQLGSVNAAATQLDTAWPSLRKAFTRHGFGMPARNPEAVRQRAIAAARHRRGHPTPPATPPLDPMFVTLNPGQFPPPRPPTRTRRAAPPGRGDRDAQYRTVIALNQESRLAPRWRIATIARRAERAQHLAGDRTGRADRREDGRAVRIGHSSPAGLVAGVWWFTPIAQVRLLQQQLSDAGGDGHHQVVTAPEGVAP